ncbi:membrane protein [Streptococcus pseudopneumoniae G42]|nr:membrane protein [Streptococcus pseudopneumoniae G42]
MDHIVTVYLGLLSLLVILIVSRLEEKFKKG